MTLDQANNIRASAGMSPLGGGDGSPSPSGYSPIKTQGSTSLEDLQKTVDSLPKTDNTQQPGHTSLADLQKTVNEQNNPQQGSDQTTGEKPQPSFLQQTGNTLTNLGGTISDIVNKSKGIGKASLGETAESGLRVAGAGAEAGNKIVGDKANRTGITPAIQTATGLGESVLNHSTLGIYDKMKEGVGHLVSGATDKYNEWAQANPEAAKDIHAIGQIAQFIPTVEGGASLIKGAGEAVAPTVSKIAENPVGAAKEGISSAKSAIQNKAVSLSNDAWAKPASMPVKFRDASEVLKDAKAKGYDLPQALTENGLHPSEHVMNGKFDTAESADHIREQAMKTSNELLRPAIEKASPNVPRTPVNEIINEAKQNIAKNKTMVAETRDAIEERLNQTQSALERKYPNGMSLTDLHDEKITRGLNVKRIPTGDVSANMEPQKNEALRDVLQKHVETKAPEGIPVHEFNDALAKQFKAADYLDALHGKNVPVSLGSKIAKTAAKWTGAAIGEAAGGGILGAAGGYHLGGMFEEMMSTLPGKVRDGLLKNLETTNPEAFAKVSDYLNKEHAIPLGPAKERVAADTSGAFRNPEFDNAVKDALHEMEQMKNRQGQEALRGIIEKQWPRPAPIPSLQEQYLLKQAKDDESRAFLKKLIDERKPEAPPVVSRTAPRKGY